MRPPPRPNQPSINDAKAYIVVCLSAPRDAEFKHRLEIKWNVMCKVAVHTTQNIGETCTVPNLMVRQNNPRRRFTCNCTMWASISSDVAEATWDAGVPRRVDLNPIDIFVRKRDKIRNKAGNILKLLKIIHISIKNGQFPSKVDTFSKNNSHFHQKLSI